MTVSGPASNPVHVVAGVLEDAQNRVLMSRRPAGAHQGGLWEFPGGKVQAGETVRTALARELEEELGVRLRAARRLITVSHDYPDRTVLLDVWRARAWDGVPRGREGQAIEWVPAARLKERALPAADLPIVTAVQLPAVYLITPDPGSDESRFLERLECCLNAGIRLVQLRCPAMDESRFRRLAHAALERCGRWNARLLLNADPGMALETGADGVHLNAARLQALRSRPLEAGRLVGASCHNPLELAQARRIGADFALLSPVAMTQSHRTARPLGWRRFAQWVAPVDLPVYALGGMAVADLKSAWEHGGQGIASMSGLWREPGALARIADGF